MVFKENEYLKLQRRVYAYLRRSDQDILALSKRPEDDGENHKLRIEKSMKAKSDIILALGPSATDKTSDMFDNDSKTAKEFREELARCERITPAQAVMPT